MTDITAKLKKVIWRSLENDFTIASFEPDPIGIEFCATGDISKPVEDMIYELSGQWGNHPKYGKQFKINSYCVQEPSEPDAIAVYLEKYIKGVGPKMAERLIERYGADTVKTLKESPEAVSRDNKGVSLDLALKISNQLKEDDQRVEMLMKLEGLFSKVKGLPKKLAADVLKVYGLTSFEIINANPYILTDMNRIGFVSADKVAMACGVTPDAPVRIKAGVLHVIKQQMQESGDIWLNVQRIIDGLMELIEGLKEVDISLMIGKMINKDEILSRYEGFVSMKNYDENESAIADCVESFLM